MEQLLETMTKPDNIPISIMLIALLICLYVSFKQAFKNDRLTQEKRHDEIYEDMIK
ncbi:MAG: hypothetical protein ACE5HK_01575 [Candidatus Methylomirabilales bacterium]